MIPSLVAFTAQEMMQPKYLYQTFLKSGKYIIFTLLLFRSKFQLLSRHDIVLREALTSDPIHSALLERVSANSALKGKILQRATVLQVLFLTFY